MNCNVQYNGAAIVHADLIGVSDSKRICDLAAYATAQMFGLESAHAMTGCPDVMAFDTHGTDACAGQDRSFQDELLSCGLQNAWDCFCPAPPPIGDGLRCSGGQCPAGLTCQTDTDSCVYAGINPHQRLLDVSGPRACQEPRSRQGNSWIIAWDEPLSCGNMGSASR